MLVLGKRKHRQIPIYERLAENCVRKAGEVYLSLEIQSRKPRILFLYAPAYEQHYNIQTEFGYEFEYHDIGKLENAQMTVQNIEKELRKLTKDRLTKEGKEKLIRYVKDVYYPSIPHNNEYWDDGFTEDDLLWK